MTTNSYIRESPGFPFILRVLWFIFIGWHVTFWWVLAAWLLNLTIIGMPLGLWMLNRVPLVLTLRTQRTYAVSETRSDGAVEWHTQGGAAEPVHPAGHLLRVDRLVYIIRGFPN